MPKYLALIRDPESLWLDPERRAVGHAAHTRFGATHGAAVVGGAELGPEADSTTIRTDPVGGVTLTDGAFAEAKEVLGGYYLLRAPDRPAACEIARHIPVLDGCIVVRDVVARGDGGPQFLALVHDREELWDDDAAAAAGYAGHRWFMAQFADAIVAGQELAPVATATTVRHGADGGVTLTDGAFFEAKEVLGGFYVIEAPDLDAALVVARDVPSLEGAVEVRPAGHLTDR